jgi:hypothetical protein
MKQRERYLCPRQAGQMSLASPSTGARLLMFDELLDRYLSTIHVSMSVT